MVLRRIRDFVVASIHHGLDRLENPIAMLNQYLRDMESEIEKAEDSLAKQCAIKKQFLEYRDEAKKMAEKRAEQAKLAIEAGNEDLARQALMEKKQYTEKAQQYDQLAKEAQQKVQELTEQLKALKEKYVAMRDKKSELIFRANAAKTMKQMQQALDKFNADGAINGFRRMEERILEMEMEAKIRKETRPYTLDDQFATLKLDEDVEKELAELKKSITA